MYSCSIPNHASSPTNFSATSAQAARVFVECGFISGSKTSHITNTLSPPVIGSGHVYTGLNTQSELSPGAWLVLEPSNPQIGKSVVPSGSTLVFERRDGVGSVPSVQMYSALNAISLPLCKLSAKFGVRSIF